MRRKGIVKEEKDKERKVQQRKEGREKDKREKQKSSLIGDIYKYIDRWSEREMRGRDRIRRKDKERRGERI